MTGPSRRIRFLLSLNNPLDAEILAWIDTLPRSARGTEMLPHLRAALIDYIRKGASRTNGLEIPREFVPSVPSRPYSPKPVSVKIPTAGNPSGSPDLGARPSALAQHLLKDFG